MEKSKSYYEGAKALENGDTRKACPYPDWSDESFDWSDGFIRAAMLALAEDEQEDLSADEMSDMLGDDESHKD